MQGDIHESIPLWLHDKERKIALLHIDVDAYEPTKFALESLIPYLVRDAIIMLDDYAHCEGAKRAIEEVLSKAPEPCQFYKAPYYVKI